MKIRHQIPYRELSVQMQDELQTVLQRLGTFLERDIEVDKHDVWQQSYREIDAWMRGRASLPPSRRRTVRLIASEIHAIRVLLWLEGIEIESRAAAQPKAE